MVWRPTGARYNGTGTVKPMNFTDLFNAHTIVADLGLVGILAIIFAETGLLIGLAFPGDSLLFIAGIAASGAGEKLLGGAHLSAAGLFIGAPIAAIAGAQVGHLFGYKYGRKLFDRPDGRFFNHKKVVATEKWLHKYGEGKALILARFVPFVRTLLPPLCGIVRMNPAKFFLWNVIGGILWTEGVIALGWILGERIQGSIDKYLLPIIALIIAVSLIPIAIEIFREWRSRNELS